MEDAIPRVNYEVMQRMQGRRVLLVCEVKSLVDGCYVVRTCDDAEVVVRPQAGGSWGETTYVEVVGTVVDARTLQEESHINIKSQQAVDFKLLNEMIKLSTGKYAGLFSG
eukprot:CAMPEP_0119106904 /NCGR_PEP_ID=MMETSP1180-20130426/7224_1 /TAXON_ID=3052 ORGANISM="Chlamydomonas cf sp, Strain CCMP681" /NCGR_SAMPLE_ID=MMETSP1180 /ASSEMBLY_ACC=CAM_ASM_000741 /LENGTH=109 /DNA_ID=CAMNT_0007092311 /DNA_START=42 /DNA_END=371 /DNA_ORIENTATION=+